MWYAVEAGPGQEEAARQQLRGLVSRGLRGECRVLYCVRKKRYLGQWHDERERFLPGYVFFVTDESGGADVFLPEETVREGLPGSSGLFAVRREEEELLMRLTGGNNMVGMSYGVIRDGSLKIQEGVLRGLEGRVKKIDRHKRKGYIAMRLGDEEKMAEIGLEITEKT